LGNDAEERTSSVVVNVQSGEQVGSFTSKATWGLALSPDGKTLAVGRASEVLMYDLK